MEDMPQEQLSKSPKDVQDLISAVQGISWLQACFSMIIIAIGAGVLALPTIAKQVGWVLASSLACLQAAMTVEAGMCMWSAFMVANENRGARRKLESYADLARAAFGRSGEIALMVPLICLSVGLASVFSIVLATGIDRLTGNHMGEQTRMFAIAPALAILSLLPKVSSIVRASPLGVASIFAACVIIAVKSLLDSHLWQAWPHERQVGVHVACKVSIWTLGTSMSILSGAFGIVPQLPSILCEMRDPAEFPKALKFAISSVLVFYLAVMNCAYYGYGQFLQPDITLSLIRAPGSADEAWEAPYDRWTGKRMHGLGAVVSALLTMKLLIVIPLILMVVFHSLQTLEGTASALPPGSLSNCVMRVSTVALVTIIGCVVHDFGKLFSLVAALCSPLLTFIYPIALNLRIAKMYNQKTSSRPSGFWHAVLIALALFTLTFGTYSSVRAILDDT